MSSIRNTVRILGNIGNDPKLIPQKNNKKLVVFPLVINENFRDKNNEKRKSEDWVNVIAWNDSAQYIHDNLKKGAFIAIDGRLKSRKLQREDKTKHITEVQVDEFVILKSNN